MKDEGILRHTDFERISARANINHTVNKFIDINGNLAYARAEKMQASHKMLVCLITLMPLCSLSKSLLFILYMRMTKTEIAYMTKKATLFMIW